MTAEALAHNLLLLWIAALAILLLRLFLLRLQREYLLFTISTALDLIFGLVTILQGETSQAVANLGLLGNTMDIFLAPSVALELFTVGGDLSLYPARYYTPIVLTMLSGLGVNVFLASSPDADSFQSAFDLAFMADTMIILLVFSFVIRKLRQQAPTADRNVAWLRRLFIVELVAGGAQGIIAPFIDAKAVPFVDCVFFAVSMAATAACALRLRKDGAPVAPA